MAVKMDGRFELVAGCFSRKKETNEATAKEYGVDLDRVYRTPDALIKAEARRIDAIVILTPQHDHHDQILMCLSANVPVICEKALASSIGDARSIKVAVEANSGFLAVVNNYTGYPAVRELRRMIRENALGEITQIHAEMPQEGFARQDQDGKPFVPQSWRLLDGEIPVVSLDLGVHLHGIIKFVTGERPLEVMALQSTFGNFNEIIDNVICLVRYSNNIESNIWYGKTALGFRNGQRIRVFGKKGSAEWVQSNPEELKLADVHGRRITFDRADADAKVASERRYTRFKAGHPAGFIEAFANHYFDIADALESHLDRNSSTQNPFVFGIDDALEGIELMHAIALSASSRVWTGVPS